MGVLSVRKRGYYKQDSFPYSTGAPNRAIYA